MLSFSHLVSILRFRGTGRISHPDKFPPFYLAVPAPIPYTGPDNSPQEVAGMFLSKLVLHNFRKFEDYTIPLHPKLNVLIGDNNAGKSTVLDAASVALGTFLLAFSPDEAISIGKDDPKLNYYYIGSVDDLQQQFPVSVTAEGCIFHRTLTWCRELTSLDGRTTTDLATDLIDVARENANKVAEGNTDIILPLVSYYGTGRLWAQKGEKKESESIMRFIRQSGYIDCLSASANEKLMFKWFEKMALQEYQMHVAIPELRAVKQAISKCLAKLNGDEKAYVEFNVFNHMLDVITKEGEITDKMPLSYMSDGYRSVLGLIGDIAYRMAILNPQLLDNVLQTPGVVLIDEVDLHLHPKWQQRILGDLTEIFPNVQFIVSTHAPMVINSVRKENIIMLIPGKMATNPPVEVYGNDASSILCSVQETTTKPVKVQKMFDEFYKVLEEKDLEKANKCLKDLENLIGEANPDLVSAQAALFFDSM